MSGERKHHHIRKTIRLPYMYINLYVYTKQLSACKLRNLQSHYTTTFMASISFQYRSHSCISSILVVTPCKAAASIFQLLIMFRL